MPHPNEQELREILENLWRDNNDPAHDIGHIKRVVATAKQIMSTEKANYDVVITAAWLHDCVNLPKNHPDRSKGSQLAADLAIKSLSEYDIPKEELDNIHHCIKAHSFSAAITPETIEAQIVQDADRIDSIGAIAIARTFATSGSMFRQIFDNEDPLGANRELNDEKFALDHFSTKLFKLKGMLNTQAAKDIAEQRHQFMQTFSEQMVDEILLKR